MPRRPPEFLHCLLLAAALSATAAQAAPERLSLELGGGTPPLSLVLVHAGAFRQGSPEAEPGRKPDEAAREVRMPRPFYMGEVPVLRAQFERFAVATATFTEAEKGTSGGHGWDGRALVQRKEYTWRFPGFAQTDQHPVVLVTWADAVAFTRWASEVTGRRVRLPTEAEWEMACRAGTETPYYGGYTADDARALGWFKQPTQAGTRAVRGKRANGLALHDLIGHVQQWTSDWYAPYAPGPLEDPRVDGETAEPGQPSRRVLRGGSWLTEPPSGRCAARARATPGSRNADFGFRVVVDVDEVAPPGASAAPHLDGPDERAGVPRPVKLALLVVGGLGLAGLARRLVRGRRASGLRTDVAADGFRVHVPESAAGRLARYTCLAGGERMEGTVVLEGSKAGHFVYTGAAPSKVEVVLLGAAAGGEAAPPKRPRRRDPEPPPFGGYPPAY